MRIVHDPARCASTGICEEAAPDVFEIRPDGSLHVRDPEPAPGQRDAVERAVRGCPTGALRLDG
jgi:ferredoxin